MRRLAQLLAGAIALGLTAMSLPVEMLNCEPPECSYESGSVVVGGPLVLAVMGFYVAVVGGIATVALAAILSLGDPASANEHALRSALGQSRRSARKAAALAGLKDGAVAVVPAWLLISVASAWIAQTSGHEWVHATTVWWANGLFAVAIILALVGAHVLTSTRGGATPVERLTADARDEQWRPSAVARVAAVLFASALIAAVAAWVAAPSSDGAFPYDTVDTAARTWSTIANWAGVVLVLSGAALTIAVVIPVVTRGAGRVLSVVARALRPGTGGLGAVLAARSTGSWPTTSRAFRALGVLAFIFALAAPAPAGAYSSPETVPAYSKVMFVADGAPGCSPDCAAAIRDIERTTGVDAAVPAAWLDVDGSASIDVVVLVSPADVEGVDPVLAEMLRDDPDVAFISWNAPLTDASFEESTYSTDDLLDVGLPVDALGDTGCCTDVIINRDWTESILGELPDDAVLVYGEPGAIDAWESTPGRADAWVASWEPHEVGDASPWSAIREWAGVLLGGALVLGPIAAIAVASVLRRRREDATLLALGATPGTLRRSIVIESSVVAALAIGSGLLGGAVTRMLAGAAGEVSDLFWDAVLADPWGAPGQVPWSLHLLVWAVAVAVFAAIAWLAARGSSGITPVEGLRPANEGGLS